MPHRGGRCQRIHFQIAMPVPALWARPDEKPDEKPEKKQRATLAIDATRGTPLAILAQVCVRC
jgi:hypothetical protein